MFFDEQIHIEEEDQCYTCEYFLKGVMCPLLEALAVGVAHLEGDVLVKNCGFYVEFKRHLQVIEGSGDPDSTDHSPASSDKRERRKSDRTKRFN
jgi:hypothetical protein